MKKILLTILRLIVELFVILLFYGINIDNIYESSLVPLTCRALLMVVMISLLYLVMQRGIKDLKWRELFDASKMLWLFKGFLTGTVYMSLTVATIALLGCYAIEEFNFDWHEMYRWLVIFMIVAIGEEIIFRGILYKRIASISNPIVALLISGLLFGLAHISNEDATLWSSIAIAIEAGGLLAASYMWSKSLLFPIGIHWAWNFVQGYVYGSPVSGLDVNSLITSKFSGNEYISGGSFGPEASVVAVVMGILFTWYFIRESLRKKA